MQAYDTVGMVETQAQAEKQTPLSKTSPVKTVARNEGRVVRANRTAVGRDKALPFPAERQQRIAYAGLRLSKAPQGVTVAREEWQVKI
jgi:hypothetical protein